MLLLNRIRTPDGTILTSWDRHDFKVYTDKNGSEYMVDGGTAYLRRYSNPGAEELSVYLTEDHEVNRTSFYWGTRGEDGQSPLRYVFLCNMSNDHIQACIDTQTHIGEEIRQLFLTELEYRTKKGIAVHKTHGLINPDVI